MNEVTDKERRAVATRIIEKAVQYLDLHEWEEADGWLITNIVETVEQELTLGDMVDCFGRDRWFEIYLDPREQDLVYELVRNALRFAVTLFNSMSEPPIAIEDGQLPSVCRKVFEYAIQYLEEGA